MAPSKYPHFILPFRLKYISSQELSELLANENDVGEFILVQCLSGKYRYLTNITDPCKLVGITHTAHHLSIEQLPSGSICPKE
jgi:hypothetical protein